jgi:polyphosphate kinase 2 (PPK2 family)
MTIDLADYELGAPFEGDYEARLAELQERVSHLFVSLNVHGKRAIIVGEGWDAAGKGGAIQRLTAQCDPRHYHVWPIAAPSAEEKARHYLWRFWQRLPKNGEVAIFDRSWYGRVLVERVEGFATEAESSNCSSTSPRRRRTSASPRGSRTRGSAGRSRPRISATAAAAPIT